jgi:AbrB family looped-hinge helix DNA binding protein
MDPIEVTKLSSKGQVVLPQGIRKKLRLAVGAKFVVLGEGDLVILKKLEVPDQEQLKQLLKETRMYAKKTGFRKSDVAKLIKQVRNKAA